MRTASGGPRRFRSSTPVHLVARLRPRCLSHTGGRPPGGPAGAGRHTQPGPRPLPRARNETQSACDGERSLAVFFDFENIGIGLNHRRDRFDIDKVLERLVEKGKIVAKKAYADWSRFAQYTAPLHEAAIELIEIPRRGQTGKNSADIRLCVDAMDLAYSKDHIDTFVIVSGDSDFSPLVSKLKELGKHVIGLGLAEATSDLLRDNCDEFIYYEDLGRAPTHRRPACRRSCRRRRRRRSRCCIESLLALRRENKEVLWSSMVKDTMKRKKPSFNEAYHGYRTFSELLEDAASERADRAGAAQAERHLRGDAVRVGTAANGDRPAEQPAPERAPAERPTRRPVPKPRPVAARRPRRLPAVPARRRAAGRPRRPPPEADGGPAEAGPETRTGARIAVPSTGPRGPGRTGGPDRGSVRRLIDEAQLSRPREGRVLTARRTRPLTVLGSPASSRPYHFARPPGPGADPCRCSSA